MPILDFYEEENGKHKSIRGLTKGLLDDSVKTQRETREEQVKMMNDPIVEEMRNAAFKITEVCQFDIKYEQFSFRF